MTLICFHWAVNGPLRSSSHGPNQILGQKPSFDHFCDSNEPPIINIFFGTPCQIMVRFLICFHCWNPLILLYPIRSLAPFWPFCTLQTIGTPFKSLKFYIRVQKGQRGANSCAFGQRRLRGFQQCKKIENQTIIKEVTSKSKNMTFPHTLFL